MAEESFAPPPPPLPPPALWAAAGEGRADKVRQLLEEGADIEERGVDESTPLYVACYFAHEAVVRLLIERGADVTAKIGDGPGDTPLFVAVGLNHAGVVRLLLESGVDPNSGGERLLLYVAVTVGNYEAVRLETLNP